MLVWGYKMKRIKRNVKEFGIGSHLHAIDTKTSITMFFNMKLMRNDSRVFIKITNVKTSVTICIASLNRNEFLPIM